MSEPQLVRATGSLTWAVRESLLRYVTVIAAGSLDTSAEVAVDDVGVFTFPLKQLVQDGHDRRFSFAGSIHFTAHHGFLDIRITDPEVIIGPQGGVLVARLGDDLETITPVVAAAATAPTAPTADGGELVWHAVPTTLLDDGVALFGDVYPAGSEMAPFGMRVALDS